jgi:large subunit ribosomal protein L22
VPGPKTNEREGTRAVLRYARISPYKVREVLNLIRGKPVGEAQDILRFTERDAGIPVAKLLSSAIANAETNDSQDSEELYVSACFADEGMTIKRWRPRARGRATRIRKRTCHVTIIVSRLPEDELTRLQARRQAEQAARRARRVAGARRAGGGEGRNRAARRQRGRVAEEPVAQEPAVSDEPVTEEDIEEVTELPVGEEPGADQVAEEAPIDEAPAEEDIVEEAPIDEAPAEEDIVEEVPTDEAPTDEAPTDEATGEEPAGDGAAEPNEEKDD